MTIRTVSLAALTAVACVRGNPELPPETVLDGGALALPECGYTVTTRLGAEAPAVATDEIGPDPTPRLVHLGLAGDPRTSIVVDWRTADDQTRATTVRFGTGDTLDHEVTGLTFLYQAGFNDNGELVRMHEAHLCGLTPDTAYH